MMTGPVEKIAGRAALEALLNGSPFHDFLRVEIADLDAAAGSLTLRLPYRDCYQRQPQSGRFHGGVIAAIIDVTGTFAMIACLERNVPTTALHIDYLRPAVATDLVARATVRRAGKTVGVVDVEVSTADGTIIALGRLSLSTVAP